MNTTIESKIFLVGQSEPYRDDPEFKEYYRKNNLSIALCIILDGNLAEPNDNSFQMINKAWNDLLQVAGVEDTGFEHWEDLFPQPQESDTED
ncbi:hypothetical protein UFOVP222_114 [uncultured Caudovirales phage]|uniref:Uncharacterized protein n=1 Tax=uncultured Caudovirales phage TaxID=2100421 RepID=A0A6J5TBF0_9CAUD|nr:hypothetical protein UFOVP108_109 [uncultured Caudovirales phage]CAB5219695.1 hypothetical protein UFOVP222_114 [uncultured Caudovirales phage]